MTLSYYADRVNLVHVLRRFPRWSAPELAHTLKRSESWVKKWRKRLAPLLDQPAALQQALLGYFHAPNHPPARLDSEVEEAIVRIRDQPPEGLRRTPGPKAIQYYLQRDETLQALGLAGSHSRRTIYQVLVKHQRIVPRQAQTSEPIERPEPMSQWQLDITDISSLPIEPDGKRQHRAEACNVVDAGTSLILDAHIRSDFTAETALQAVAQSFQTHGLPDGIRIDRDPLLSSAVHKAAIFRQHCCAFVPVWT